MPKKHSPTGAGKPPAPNPTKQPTPTIPTPTVTIPKPPTPPPTETPPNPPLPTNPPKLKINTGKPDSTGQTGKQALVANKAPKACPDLSGQPGREDNNKGKPKPTGVTGPTALANTDSPRATKRPLNDSADKPVAKKDREGSPSGLTEEMGTVSLSYKDAVTKGLLQSKLFTVTKNDDEYVHLTREEYTILAQKLSVALLQESAKGRTTNTAVKWCQFLGEKAVIAIHNKTTQEWLADKISHLFKGYRLCGSNEGPNLYKYGVLLPIETCYAGDKLVTAGIQGTLQTVHKEAKVIPVGKKLEAPNKPGQQYWFFGLNKEAHEAMEKFGGVISVGLNERRFVLKQGPRRTNEEVTTEAFNEELIDLIDELEADDAKEGEAKE